MRILAIGAHPDDVEMLCAGTLAKCANEGHEIWIAIATNGNVGSPDADAATIARIRKAESTASCEIIGAQLIWMDFDDEWLFNDRPTRRRFIEAIREARPDLIFAHNADDYHPDHRIAGQLASDARMPSAVRLVTTSLPALEQIPDLLFMDSVGRAGFVPDAYVEISETIETKQRMLERHQSQAAWMDDFFGMQYVDFMKSQARERGREFGVPLAEAFRLLNSYPPPRMLGQLTGLMPVGSGEAAR